MTDIPFKAPGRGARFALALVLCLSAWLPACSSSGNGERRVRFWHAFNAEETEALNRSLKDWREPARVEPVRETFARGLVMLRQILAEGKNCPDLARIDATWLPGLAADKLLSPTPSGLIEQRRWLKDALELASYDSKVYGLPQSIDGLALLHPRAGPGDKEGDKAGDRSAAPAKSLDELVDRAKALSSGGKPSLGLQVDGYWFVPFLRQWGMGLIDVSSGRIGVDCPESAVALERFAGLFGTVAPPLSPSGKDAEGVTRRFRSGELSMVISGPWAVADLSGGDTTELAVSPLPGAPLGGQVLVVPHCASEPGAAWKLAEYLTSPAVQGDWSRRLGIIATTEEGLAGAGEFVNQFRRALATARPLPRHPVTPELFDDLGPAVRAVVARDATAVEALPGVGDAWARLLEGHGVKPVRCAKGDAAEGDR